MMRMIRRRGGRALRRMVLLSLATAGLGGCGLLDVSDPTAVEQRDLSDAAGAELLRGAALRTLATLVEGKSRRGGMLADELLCCLAQPDFGLFFGVDWLNRRASAEAEARGAGNATYTQAHQLRTEASVALQQLRAYGSRARAGEMYGVRAYGALSLAETFCPGFPLREVVDYQVVAGPPLSTEAVLERALADYDSALTYAADSARILHFVRVGRARTLLNLGRFAEAASAVAGVPTIYVARAEYAVGVTSVNNNLALDSPFFTVFFFGPYGVADREGGSGLDFVSANDPRVRTTPTSVAANGTQLYGISKYPNQSSPIVVASGIEARLIEAEATLQADANNPQWLTILNTLRTDGTQDGGGIYNPGTGGVAGLAPLTDPGTDAARVDLVFRERAFWLFATGTRLADLRRLIRLYGRASDSVFPTGAYPDGGVYGTATSIPFPAVLETPHNPAVTGCTSR